MPNPQNRYQQTFTQLKQEDKIAFIPFWMIGDPTPEDSLEAILKIAEKADILELGLPFSDPLADGATIQAAVNRALQAGTNTNTCLDILEKIRNKFPEKPIGLLVYFNLIIQYGVENFFGKLAEVGIDSVLIPELPIEAVDQNINQEASIKATAKKYNIDLIFLVSTNTPKDRTEKILAASGGFLYAISTPSITGAKTDLSQNTLDMVQDLKSQTDLPICVGFGISEPEHVAKLHQAGADGAIIGSRLINIYQEKDLTAVLEFCEQCQT